jgi:hypothetical protein
MIGETSRWYDSEVSRWLSPTVVLEDIGIKLAGRMWKTRGVARSLTDVRIIPILS